MDTNIFSQPLLTEEEEKFLRAEIERVDAELKEILKKECFTEKAAAAGAQDKICKTKK